MLIYKITYNLTSIDTALTNQNVEVEKVFPSRFSFVTSLRCASALKQKRVDIIIAEKIKDTVGAISSLKLLETLVKPKVILSVIHSTKVPKTIQSDIAKNISAVIFDNYETLSRWKQVRGFDTISKTVIIPLPAQPITEETEPSSKRRSNKLVLLHMGPITDGAKLKSMCEYITKNDMTDNISIRVAGTGKPRIVMPIIKWSRASRINIEWLGDDYDSLTEMRNCDGFIAMSPSLSEAEIKMLSLGKPNVDTHNVKDWINEDKRKEMKLDAKKNYNDNHSPEKYVERLKQLIEEIN